MLKIFLLVFVLMLSVIPAGAQRLNVRDFGARGNGIADDAPALQRALNRMDDLRRAAAGIYLNDYGTISSWGVWDGPNAEVFLPAGTYRIGRTLVGVKGVTLSGELGTTIQADFADAPLLYLDMAFRGTIRGITFRGGRNQIVYWTANQNAARMLIDDCRFENAVEYAILSESFSDLDGSDMKNWEHCKPLSPFLVKWDKDRMPTVTPSTGRYPWANSTLVVLRNCRFTDCGGAYRGASDGQSISNCSVVCRRPPTLPPWDVGNEIAMEQIDMKAELPKNFFTGWIVCQGPARLDLRRIRAESTSATGAPLLVYRKAPRSKEWNPGDNLTLTDCTATSAGSSAGALIEFAGIEPMLLEVTRCREFNGRQVEMFRFRQPPQNHADLLRAYITSSIFPNPDPKCTHSWRIAGNGTELAVKLPSPLIPYATIKPTEKSESGFPTADYRIPPWNSSGRTRFNAADFGIGVTPAPDDEIKLEQLFRAAAKVERATIRLPGRVFLLNHPLTLPPHASISASGRAFFSGRDHSFPLLQVVGKDLNLELTDLTFNGGAAALKAQGAGRIRIDNCILYDNNDGIDLEQTGKVPLRLEASASSFHVPVALTNHGGDVLIRDFWGEVNPTLSTGAWLRNRGGGTLTVANLLGVPLVFLGLPSRPDWKAGKDLYWLENDGVLYSRFNRFGGESDGIPILDNYGAGRALLTGRTAYFGNPHSCLAFFRNHDRAGQIIIRGIGSFHGLISQQTLGVGIRPAKLAVSNYLDPALIVRPGKADHDDLKHPVPAKDVPNK